MARIEIRLPKEFDFSVDIPIRIGDINRGNHLGHDALLMIMEEARVQFFSQLGYSEQVGIDKGIGYITADTGIIYERQAHYGQTVKVEIAATDFNEKSFDFMYRVTEVKSGEEIARAKQGTLFYDYRLQKVVPVPEDFRSRFLREGDRHH